MSLRDRYRTFSEKRHWERLLQEMLDLLPAPATLSARIEQDPRKGGLSLNMRVRVEATDHGSEVRPRWEAYLLNNAFFEALDREGRLGVGRGRHNIALIAPDGTVRESGGGPGRWGHGLSNVPRTPPDVSFESVAAIVAAYSAHLDELVLLMAPTATPAMLITALDDEQAARAYRSLNESFLGCPGHYIEIKIGDRTVVRAGAAWKSRVGSAWIDPTWAGARLTGVNHSSPVQPGDLRPYK